MEKPKEDIESIKHDNKMHIIKYAGIASMLIGTLTIASPYFIDELVNFKPEALAAGIAELTTGAIFIVIERKFK